MNSVVLRVAALVVIFGRCGLAHAGPSVVVDGVTIDGTVSPVSANVNDYFGIPYATAARWSPPRAHARLANPFDASQFSTVNVCPQPSPVVLSGYTLPQSENCLSLTVHVPASAKTKSKLPVYVFIHGGALTTGAGVEYYADDMAALNDIVVVSINYRPGVLGWLAQSALESRRATRSRIRAMPAITA
jgi:para-nitrobenzyl esterase